LIVIRKYRLSKGVQNTSHRISTGSMARTVNVSILFY
jgi:hypothetical protein